MSTTTQPWYISERAVTEYRRTITDENLPMIKSLKILRSILVNLGILGLSFYSVSAGGDPTLLGFVGLAVLGAYNGLEFSDYLALVRAYDEVQNNDNE